MSKRDQVYRPPGSRSTRPVCLVHLRLPSTALKAFPPDSLPNQQPFWQHFLTDSTAHPSQSHSLSSSRSPSTERPSKARQPQRDSSLPPEDANDGQDDPANALRREADAAVDGDDQAKPKPPRKRNRGGEANRLDGRTSAAKAQGYQPPAHRLGPKANQGAINEKLRALDRTTKPCRKWQKTGFQIKSFTGRTWELPTWRASQVRLFGTADPADGTHDGSVNGVSKDNSSSNVGSDRTPALDRDEPPSSPVRPAGMMDKVGEVVVEG